jgi:thiol:disulfide interchange protein DsbD
MKILPKPGAWMERVKQFMAFPLLATLIWLLSVLGGQKGLGGVIWAAAFLLCLGLACWIYGAFAGPFASGRSRVISFFLILAIVGGGGWVFLGNNFAQSQASGAGVAKNEGGIPWQDFSTKELAALRAAGKPVFVDFTADWCISCKFNERTAIDVPAVRAAFQESGIIAMRADWTNANPEITAALKEFGRVGVPFYVLYPSNNGEPIILPELLTQQIVLDALAKAN